MRVLAPLAAAVITVALAACSQGTAVGTVRPGATAGATQGAVRTSDPGAAREPNVISGRVTTETGEPVPGAQLRIVGYTGGANLGQEFETVESGADGRYRTQVPRGLYEVNGQAALAFDGQSYTFDLQPVDGDCEQQMSDDGIVKDFELRLTGMRLCTNAPLPDNYLSYNGAAIQLQGRWTNRPSDSAIVEYTLQPVGSLANGAPGQTITMRRTVQALETSAGPIDGQWMLYDIPLAIYDVSATLVGTDGTRTPLYVDTNDAPGPTGTARIRFGARGYLGGYDVPTLRVWDEPELG